MFAFSSSAFAITAFSVAAFAIEVVADIGGGRILPFPAGEVFPRRMHGKIDKLRDDDALFVVLLM